MSDNSTGSTGSSSNSWTLLSPEEAAADPAAPVDDGTESLGDAASLSEELAGSLLEGRSLDPDSSGVESIMSEEGRQVSASSAVCQETSPECFEEITSSGPPASADLDPEIHAPIIHDTITSSPPDSDLLGAVPFSIATEPAFQFSEEAEEPTEEDITGQHVPVQESPVAEPEPKITSTTEPKITSTPEPKITSTPEPKITSTPEPKITSTPEPKITSTPEPKITSTPEPKITSTPEPKKITSTPEPKITSTPESFRKISPSHDVSISEVTADISSAPEISDSSVFDIHADVHPVPESPPLAPPSEEDTGFGSTAESPAPDIPYAETIGPGETEEEEPAIDKQETELLENIPDVVREPEAPAGSSAEDDGLRLRRVQPTIVLKRSSDDEEEEEEEFNLPERKEEKRGFSLNQLIVGALVLLCVGSFFFSNDFDGAELSDQELLDKFAQENEQINILEAQIELQKQELDRALKTAKVMHSSERDSLETENTQLKEQLSELPHLREELETLRIRVAELTQLTVREDLPQHEPTTDPTFTSESDKTGTEKHGDKKAELKRQKGLLEESRKRLEGMKNKGWNKHSLKENMVEMQKRLLKQVDQLGRREEWKRKQKEHKGEKKEWGRKKDQNHHQKEEMEKEREWKHGKKQRNGDNKHKVHLRKYNEEWDHKKNERRLERERRQRDKPWKDKSSKHQHHHHHHEQFDFWKHQEEKLRRNKHPAESCHGVDSCADAEGFVPVKLIEFQDLLEVYLNKLEGVPQENKEALHRLTSQFFSGGFFLHDKMLFSEFAEDVADILEDLADVMEDAEKNDSLEEQMEEFEKDALLKFTTLKLDLFK